MFIYQRLCRDIIQAIDQGILVPGDRLDPVRVLARKRGIGVSTATQVYRELERLGRIRAEPKRGYFVADSHPSAAPPSYGNQVRRQPSLSDRPLPSAVQYSLNDPGTLPLSCTAPSTVVDNETLLMRMQKRALKQRPYRLDMVDPIEGLPALRAEIARQLLSHGQVVASDQLLITNGRKEALLLALQACRAINARIAIEAPSSYYFQSMLEQWPIDTLAIPMQADFNDELALLDQAYRENPFCAYLLNPSFNDPTGRLLSRSDKERLIQWATTRKVTLIEYDRGDLYFGAERPPSIASLVPAGNPSRVITLCDFLDTVSPTFSLGYMICRNTFDDCLAAKLVLAEEPAINTQYMLLALMQSGEYQRQLTRVRRLLGHQATRMRNILRQQVPAEVYISKPDGGPCLWLVMPHHCSSQALWHLVIRDSIAIAPGCLFSSDHAFDHCFRITYGLPWDSRMENGIAKLAEHLKQYVDLNS